MHTITVDGSKSPNGTGLINEKLWDEELPNPDPLTCMRNHKMQAGPYLVPFKGHGRVLQRGHQCTWMSKSALFFDLHSGHLSVIAIRTGWLVRQVPDGLSPLHWIDQHVPHPSWVLPKAGFAVARAPTLQ